MHRHAVEYSTYPRGPRSGPGCSVPRRTQILLRNIPSSGTVPRLYQRSGARPSATNSDRLRPSVRLPIGCNGFCHHRGTPVGQRATSRRRQFGVDAGCGVLRCDGGSKDLRPRNAFQPATTLQCLRYRHFLPVWQPLHRGPCSAVKKCG